MKRTSALSVAILSFATVSINLSVADDFSALLADLSFGDVPSIEQPLAIATTTAPDELKQVEELKPLAALQPAPSMAFTMPGMLESEVPEVAAAPQVALQDPIPTSTPESPVEIDLDAAFALQDVQAAKTDIISQAVGYPLNRCDVQSCDSGITCMPHVDARLPSSTLYQYFRSNPCYTNVWDGYSRRCGDHHKHLHGTCDCFTKSSKDHCWTSALSHLCDRNDCGDCDAGCDR